MTGRRLHIDRANPAYWKVTIDNPPINLYDPEMFAELRVFMDSVDASEDLKIVVVDSANPDYFVAHYDVVRGRELPDMEGAAPSTEWPAFVTRLTQSRVVSVAKIRGRARGHGSELALACDMRFASLEKAVFAQIEVGMGVVPGGGATEWLSALAGRSRTLEIILGANDFDAATAEKYGWINRAVLDADLDEFVEDFAQRVAGFERRTLELAKKLVNARTAIASDAERWSSNHVFLGTATWPETGQRVGQLMQRGLQQDGPFELELGRNVAQPA